MNILFITAFTPSEIGAAVKNTKMTLASLSEKHKVDLIYCRYKHDPIYSPPNDNITIKFVWQNVKWLKLLNVFLLPLLYPQFTARFNWWYKSRINRLVKKNNYDAIIFDHSQMFLYARNLENGIHKVLFSHDVVAQRAQRAYGKLAYKWCVLSEKFCLKVPNSRIFTFSQKDCKIIKNLYDFDSFVSAPYLEPNVLNVIPNKINEEFVLFGVWSRSDNLNGALWFFDKVAHLLNKTIRIKMIGKGFTEIRLGNLNEKIIVEYLGFVEDPYVIIANCKAVLAPIFTGAGLKFKVAESLACGTPVIGTEVALEGLPEECSEWMLLANDEVSFAKYVENIDFSLESRKKLKKRFLDCFDKDRVPDYIDSISQNV